jgi:hypothetical protein
MCMCEREEGEEEEEEEEEERERGTCRWDFAPPVHSPNIVVKSQWLWSLKAWPVYPSPGATPLSRSRSPPAHNNFLRTSTQFPQKVEPAASDLILACTFCSRSTAVPGNAWSTVDGAGSTGGWCEVGGAVGVEVLDMLWKNVCETTPLSWDVATTRRLANTAVRVSSDSFGARGG